MANASIYANLLMNPQSQLPGSYTNLNGQAMPQQPHMAIAPQQMQGGAAPSQISGLGLINPQAALLAQQNQQLAQELQATEQRGGSDSKNWGALAANLGAAFFNKQALAKNQKALVQAQYAQTNGIAQHLFPNDPQMQLAYLLDPKSTLENYAKRAGPLQFRQGETVANAPSSITGGENGTFTAPIYQDQGGQVGSIGPNGYTPLGQRAPGYGEQTAAAAQAEKTREDLFQDPITAAQLRVAQQNAHSQAISAGAAAQNANTGQANSGNVGPPPGYQMGGGLPGNFQPPPGFIIGEAPQ